MTEQDRTPAIGDFRFETVYRPNPKNPQELIAEDWVTWVKLGDQMGSRTREKIARLMPKPERERPAALEWGLIERFYEAWKKQEELPVDGTPLASWPGCDPKLAEELKRRNVLTVEQFADLPDHYTGGIPMPDIRVRKKAAADFLEAKRGKDAAKEAMADELAKLRAELEALKGGDDAPKRRGRPPKAETLEAAE